VVYPASRIAFRISNENEKSSNNISTYFLLPQAFSD
jgi:hypothetical protein